MFFLPSSSLLVDHITRYARSSRLEYNTKNPINFCSTYLSPVPKGYLVHGFILAV
jgi:hypothetical protein